MGFRGIYVINSVSTGHSSVDKHIKIGMGFGGGLLFSIPITDMITLVPEANFLYRTLMNQTESDEYCDSYGCEGYKYEYSASEFALSFPIMFQFMPIAGTPVYFAGGVQIDIPFSSKMNVKWREWDDYYDEDDSGTESEKIDDRAGVDFGIAIGSGFRWSNFGIDFKIVIGMNDLVEDEDGDLTQYGFGVSVFF